MSQQVREPFERVLDRRRPSWPERVVRAVSARRHRPSRRSFLARTAVAATALAVAPKRYVLEPVGAADAICGPATRCSDGWTVFCCTINGGRNECPPGTIAAGWWKNDTTPYCDDGPRYIVDCNSTCGGCRCGRGGICGPSCWTCSCRCNDDPSTCDRRRVCCNEFRYGQCNQQVACVGPVVCRIATCAPPWEWDPSCTRTPATANETSLHTAPCVTPAVRTRPEVYGFGAATPEGAPPEAAAAVVDIVGTPSGRGYWITTADGGVFTFGDARFLGSLGDVRLNRPITAMAVTPSGLGYWLVASDGGVFTFGDAGFYGSLGAIRLNAPIVGFAPTPTGRGYWMAAADGGIFTFGDADFFGSLGAIRLNAPVLGLDATPSGRGYWMVASDGGVFTFGDAGFFGSLGAIRLNAPIVGIAATPTGLGYWMVGADGGVFAFGDARFLGSLPQIGVRALVSELESTPAGDGYWIAGEA